MEIKKAIIPIAGLGTRFLPMSKVLSKEFFPLVDRPVIQYIIDEVKKSGITEIVFIVSPKQKTILNFFEKDPELEKILVKRKKESILKDLKDFENSFEGISISFAVQKFPLGDGHAIFQAAKFVKNEPVANSFGDDIVDSDTPALQQLAEIFRTCNAPVLGLKTVPKEKVPAYGMVVAEKISNRLYKIKKIVEKPDLSQVTSNLVVIGKHILTPEVFDYLKKAKPSKKGEIILAEVLDKMLADGKIIYGYELRGEWLECGDKLKWLKSFLYFALKDPRFGKDLKEFIKTIK
ncbi:MAG: UTP--glucose-1-phosphate uridylyltransferase [Patescibacteria group bacterium]